MLVAAAALVLTVAALGGGALAVLHLRGLRVPAAAGLAHGAVAVLGVVALLVAVVGGAGSLPLNAAAMLLVLAVIGGAFVLLFRFEGDAPPGFMIVLHALAALVGVAVLWIGLAG